MSTAATPVATTSSIATIGPSRRAPTRLSADSVRCYFGILGVLIGSVMATLATRVTTLGLADIRGAVHAGFDEGAWITTSQTVAQMLVTLVAIWLGAIYGTRKV